MPFPKKIEFFAENLNYGRQVNLKDGVALTDSTKYCYDDDPLYCENHFGDLYTWSMAMGLPAACDSVELGGNERCLMPTEKFGSHGKITGICPKGWHIMNGSDFVGVLLAINAARTVQSPVGWNDAGNWSGFSALPGGGGGGGEFSGLGKILSFGSQNK